MPGRTGPGHRWRRRRHPRSPSSIFRGFCRRPSGWPGRSWPCRKRPPGTPPLRPIRRNRWKPWTYRGAIAHRGRQSCSARFRTASCRFITLGMKILRMPLFTMLRMWPWASLTGKHDSTMMVSTPSLMIFLFVASERTTEKPSSARKLRQKGKKLVHVEDFRQPDHLPAVILPPDAYRGAAPP